MKKIVLISIFLLPAISFGAKSPSITKLKDNLGAFNREINSLGASIKSMEKDLGDANEKYVYKIKKIEKVENLLNTLRGQLDKNKLSLLGKEKKSKELLGHYLIENVDNYNNDRLLKQKLYLAVLKKKMKQITSLRSNSNKLDKTVREYQSKLIDLKADEGSLYSLIVDLDSKKKLASQNYINKLEQKNILEDKLETQVARFKALRKKRSIKKRRKSRVPSRKSKIAKALMALDLRKPVDKYISLKGSKKGVTYKYNTAQPIYASLSGKIVYSGELASYGKVLMIDHGKEIRSVMLGDITFKATKGQMVKRGDVVAITNADPGLTKSLYYEVRKKNIAQNTLKVFKNKKI